MVPCPTQLSVDAAKSGPLLDVVFRFVLRDSPELVSASAGVEALLGFTPEQFLTSKVRFEDRVHRDDASVGAFLFSQELEDRTGIFNIRLRHADGRIRCVKGRYTKTRKGPGGDVHLDLQLEDARQVREPGDASLIASFKSLIEQSTDYIYIKNRNHVILAASQTLPNLTESAKDLTELAGKTDYDLHPEEAADDYYRLEEQAFTEGKRVNQIQQVLSQDGTKRWIDNRKYPINGPDGEIIGIFGVAPDITEPIEMRSRLLASEESLREAQAIAGLSSYVLDIPSKQWTISPELEALLGIDAEYGRAFESVWPLIHPDDRPMMAERFKAYFLGERTRFDSEYRIVRHSDKTVRWVHTRGRLEVDAEGKPLALRGTIQDITDRKRAEAALRESDETLREAQRIAGLGIHVMDFSTGAWSASEVLREILGVGPDHDLSPAGWMALIHPEDHAAVHACFAEEAISTGLPFEIEHRIIRHSDQAERWVHAVGRVECDEHGKPVKLRGTVFDITDRRLAEAALRENKDLLQLFIEHAPASLAMFDREMRYLAVSRRWLEVLSLIDVDVLGRSHYEILPEVPESWREEHQRSLAGEKMPSESRQLVMADGTVKWMQREILPWRAGDGSVGGIVIFSDDITAKKLAEERLRLAASVFSSAREGITITDPEGTILEVNEAFTRITGYSREEVLGQNPRLLKSGLQSEEFYKKMWGTLTREGHWSGEIWNRSKSGDIYPEMLSVNAIRDANGKTTQYVALFSDITEIKKQQQELEHMAHYDALTGLPNRVLFADRLRQAMAQAHRSKRLLAVAYFDLDGFKAINDRYGHSVGDGLLTAMAFRMKRVMREGDTLARLGGDEFATVMLDLHDTKACAHSLNRLLAAASKEAQIGDYSLRVSASAGVTFYPQAEEVDAEVLLRQAGQAMYQAKLTGRNRYHNFDPSEDLNARSRHENLEHIRKALAARQFVLHYQPKVNMRTGKVVGAEALVRWQHPERGLLPPGMFLPIIEDHPLAVELGEWMIENVLTQMEAWSAAGLDLPISVNVSAFELQQPNFADRLRARLAAHPLIKPSSLQLEVLETSALQDVIQASHVLNVCREIGVSIGIDDFGTGYSSLTYLKRLPANVLKIDQSFVRDMLEEPDNLTILEGVLGLAAAFRRDVIAEGVETVEHGLMLLHMGCEIAQGYGIARPMPADELGGWISTWRPDPRWADVPPVHAGNRPVLYACIEHDAWLAAFEAFLQGKRSTPPSLDAGQCRIGAFLSAEKQSARGELSVIQSVEALHEQLHILAADIYTSQSQGRKSEGLAHLHRLRELHGECLKKLKTFTDIGSVENGKKRSRKRNGAPSRAIIAKNRVPKPKKKIKPA
jgi:diguanylate cyclase (GGDEF)-like protein/PAS domain S-box-containing protein